MPSDYHKRKFKKCKYCDKEAKRQILPNGRNKGHYRTCGSEKCLIANYKDINVISKKKHLGKENPRWLGNRKLVKRPRTSFEGTKWRREVFKRDNYTCQECGKRGGKLSAHHIKNYWLFPELRWELNNGTTLCQECHKNTDDYGWKSINIRRQYVTVS